MDVEVTPLTPSHVVNLILDHARHGTGLVIGNLNLHGAYVYHTDAQFRAYCESSDLVLVDGAPIAWAGGIPVRYRVGSTDWLDELMPIASGLKILAIGGTPEAAAGAQEHMREAYPEVDWVGVDGYSSQDMSEELATEISSADIILVGMGMPLQERWLMKHASILTNKVVANVGGCIDYYAGQQRLAPRWLGPIGIEWGYRLLRDPRRLGHRYLVEPLLLLGVLLRRPRG
jgi:N-acetylglucosaminyldiphosphoundecaprenol N-acetyl-beta-D-mannosaminyltransferase